jgi:hypothetical protein
MQNKHCLCQNMMCNKEGFTRLFGFATKYALQYTSNKYGIVCRFKEMKLRHIDLSLSIIDKDNIRHPISWHTF